MSAKYVMSFTCKDKIDSVFAGTCRQTIRPGRKYKVGDEILIHTWTGKPYYSKWGRRMRITLNYVEDIMMAGTGILFPESDCNEYIHWKHLDELARQDGFDHWFDMYKWFTNMYRFTEPREFQILRW